MREKGRIIRPTVAALLLLVSSGGYAQSREAKAGATKPCPVTLPNGSQPPTKMLSGPLMHGNGKLWVVLTPDGKWRVKPSRGGSIVTKLAWWREVKGPFTIEGRRLDAPAGPLRSISNGGDSGFLPSNIFLPSAGCWEITGKVA